jgi:Na+/H+ antiporter NhaC
MFAVTVGTGMGTIIGFTAVMYPAGIVLGASPAALIGAIMSGAAFGDNMAPISDTTIVSATTQEADVGGVVRSRLKYTLVAGGLAALLFLFIGQGDSSMDQSTAKELLEGSANPHGLIMLIAAVVMVAMAVTGRPFLLALTSGIATAIIVGLVGGAFTAGDIVHVTDDGALGGALINGIGGMIDICVLTLVLVTSIGIMEAGGAHQRVMGFLDRSIAKTIRGAEFAIVGFISILNMCVSINTVAMIAGGPMVNEFRKRHGISKYRSANLLDTISCSFPYILPYSGPVLAIAASQKAAAESYDFVPIVGWSELIFHYHYGNVLFPLMIVAVITGYGRGNATD